jgi:signal transduction histidine kinase/DNA-binding NarL/FixJ family response regulator
MGALRRLAVLLPGRHLRLLGVVALVSMFAASAEFVILVSRENDLVDRFSDSTWWMASKFREEIQTLHVSLAAYDGSPAALQAIQDNYDIVFSRIDTMENAQLEPKPDPAFLAAFRRVRDRILALEPRVTALKPGELEPARALTADIERMEADAGHMTTLGAQEDAGHRGALRAAVGRANIAFGLTSFLLIASLLLTLRAVMRQAVVVDAARRRSEALSAELTVALAQAQAGERAKSAFLATMSHEIRTPMNGVLGAASLLALTRLSDVQRRWVAIVKACGEALLAQLDDVLDFSALEADAIVLQPGPVDIRELVLATARVVEGTAGQKGLEVAVAVDPDVPGEVITDRRRLGQVLLNLITNATKFTASGGIAIRVALRRRHGRAWLRVAVIDTGPGVPRAERARIFEEFTRLERAVERDARGTGLGLAISRRVVAALRGTLCVAGAVGGGSVFWLRIPVEIPPGAAAPAPRPAAGSAAIVGGARPIRRALEVLLRAEGYTVASPPAAGLALLLAHSGLGQTQLPPAARTLRFGAGTGLDGTLSGETLHAALTGTATPSAEPLAPEPITPASAPLRLLVADDDPINREIAASLMRHLGHVVSVASDGPDALALARAQPFDCILLDLHMPGLDGAELARTLRDLPGPVATTRLVAVTADVDATSHAALTLAGFDAIVTKPVTLERLAAALPAAGPAPPAAAPQAPADTVIDVDARAMLASRLAPDRFNALVRTFWEELVRALEQPGGYPGPGADRRLHSLAGSSASLGYLAVAAAARRSRTRLAADGEATVALAELHAALGAALGADVALLPEALAGRAAAALAASRQRLDGARPRADTMARAAAPAAAETVQ